MDLVIISHVMTINVQGWCSRILRTGQFDQLGIAARTAKTCTDCLADSLSSFS